MKKILLFLFLLVGLNSCQNNPQNKISTTDTLQKDIADSSVIEEKPTGKLGAYKQFLSELDLSKIENNVVAAKKFQDLFATEWNDNPILVDSAYLLFLDFYTNMEVKLTSMLDENAGYDSLLFHHGPDVTVKLSDRLLNYQKQLTENGFALASDEGTTYIVKDGDFSQKWFYGIVSPAMKEYLIQENKERKAGFATDGGIIIECKDLADRTVWWEKFVANHPDFILISNAKQHKREYFYASVTGMDNTPLMEHENPEQLSAYFSDLYTYLIATYPDTESARLIKPYYKVLKDHKLYDAERIRKQFIKL